MSDVLSAIARVSQIVQGLREVRAVASGNDFASVLEGAAAEPPAAGAASVEPTSAVATIAAPSASTLTQPSDQAERAVRLARTMLGRPYVWGAEGPGGFDCSGLVYWAYHAAGSDLPRLTADGYLRTTTPVARQDLRPGDLVFFNYGRLAAGHADHVGIYVGDGKVIEASSSSDAVVIRPVDWEHFLGGGRPR